MNDPQRILDERAGELEADLLRAMKGDAPSASARKRTLAALGIASVAIGTSASASAAGASAAGASAAGASSKLATTLAWSSIGKWLGIGVVTGVASVAAVQQLPSIARPHSLSASGAQAPRTTRPHTASKPVVAAPRAQDGENATLSPPVENDTQELAAPAVRKAPSNRPSQSVSEELRAEVASLDKVREQTASGDPRRALELLEQHERKFQNRALDHESEILRIEAIAASGHKQIAAARAQKFLAQNPTSPHAEKLRALVARDFSASDRISDQSTARESRTNEHAR